MGRRRRPKKAKHTDDWQELFPLFDWPEQQAYEEIRPLVLLSDSVTESANEGMLSLFGTDPATARAKRRGLEPAIRRMIVELKAERSTTTRSKTSFTCAPVGGSASTPPKGSSQKKSFP